MRCLQAFPALTSAHRPLALADAHNDHITLSKDLEVERTGPQILVEDMGALEASFNMRNAAQKL